MVAHGPLAQARMVGSVAERAHPLLQGSVAARVYPLLQGSVVGRAYPLLQGSVVAHVPPALLVEANSLEAQHLPHSRRATTSLPTADPSLPPEPSSRTRLSRPQVFDASLVLVQEPREQRC